MQAERPILRPPAPVTAPASLPSPAARSRSLCPGLYLQTLHSSHGRCQLLRPPRSSCPCSPLAHCSFTAPASCHHHHPPLNSSRFLPGHVQAGAATATARLPTDTRSLSHLPLPRHLPPPPAPANRATSQQAQPAEHCHSKGPFGEQQGGFEAVLSAVSKKLRSRAQKLTRPLAS